MLLSLFQLFCCSESLMLLRSAVRISANLVGRAATPSAMFCTSARILPASASLMPAEEMAATASGLAAIKN